MIGITHGKSHTQPKEGTIHKKAKNQKQTSNHNTTGRRVQVCYVPRHAAQCKREKHNDNHANKGDQEVWASEHAHRKQSKIKARRVRHPQPPGDPVRQHEYKYVTCHPTPHKREKHNYNRATKGNRKSVAERTCPPPHARIGSKRYAHTILTHTTRRKQSKVCNATEYIQ